MTYDKKKTPMKQIVVMRGAMGVCSCTVLQETYRVAAAVSLHLDTLVWDLHVGQLQRDTRWEWLRLTSKRSGWPE